MARRASPDFSQSVARRSRNGMRFCGSVSLSTSGSVTDSALRMSFCFV